jgi:5-methylcytosine-specific restriction endonuclease McrA
MADTDNARPVVTWEAARLAGLTRYYTGIPCQRGHISERHTSSATCMACSAENVLRRYYKNHESMRAAAAIYRSKNRNKIRAWQRAFYAANADKIKRENAAYFNANRAARVLQRRAYRVANKALYAARDEAYRIANPERVLVIKRRYRARLRGAAGNHTSEQIKAMQQQQGHRCANCRVSTRKGYHVDHIVPLKLGGSNDISNIQLLCRSCNCGKGGKDPLIWAQELGRLL